MDEARRGEQLHALATIVGVALILALLWGVGVVAQGQVERAQARVQELAHQQASRLRCAAAAAAGAGQACGALGQDAQAQVLAVYR